MAKLVRLVNNIDERAKLTLYLLVLNYSTRQAFSMVKWHWLLIDTTPAEVAYFQSLGDNDDEHNGLHKETLIKPYPGVPEVW